MNAAPRLALALPCLIMAVCSCASRTEPVTYDKSYSIEGRATVHVHTNEGSIRVLTSDTQAVEFHVDYAGGNGLAGPPHIASRQQGGLVELEANAGATSFFFGGGTRRMDIEVSPMTAP